MQSRSPYLVRIHVTLRGDLAQLMSDIHYRLSKSPELRRTIVDDPMRVVLKELIGDQWTAPPSAEAERMWADALPETGDGKWESMRGELDPERFLDLAEQIANDGEFAERFRQDPAGFLHEHAVLPAQQMAMRAKTSGKLTSKHTWECKGEIDGEIVVTK